MHLDFRGLSLDALVDSTHWAKSGKGRVDQPHFAKCREGGLQLGEELPSNAQLSDDLRSAYVTLGDLHLEESFSLAMHLKNPTSRCRDSTHLFAMENGWSNVVLLKLDGGQLQFWVCNPDWNQRHHISAPVQDGALYAIVATYRASDGLMKLYLNGQEVASGNAKTTEIKGPRPES